VANNRIPKQIVLKSNRETIDLSVSGHVYTCRKSKGTHAGILRSRGTDLAAKREQSRAIKM